MDGPYNMRRRCILLKKIILLELLRFWPDVIVQQFIKIDIFDFIIEVILTYVIVGVHSTDVMDMHNEKKDYWGTRVEQDAKVEKQGKKE